MALFSEFEDPDVFTTGAIGRPGARTFFIEVRSGTRHLAVKCEKQQVAAMAKHLTQVLVDLPPAGHRPLPGALDLSDALESAFVLGPIGLGYDRTTDRIVIQLEEMLESDAFEDSDDSDDPDALTEDEPDRGQIRIRLSRDQAAAFCEHAAEVVAAGRPNCRWCSLPIDPDGHRCPRMN